MLSVCLDAKVICARLKSLDTDETVLTSIRQVSDNFSAMTQKNWPDRVHCLNPASLNAAEIFGVTCRIQV
jgi:hypothetical protein